MRVSVACEFEALIEKARVETGFCSRNRRSGLEDGKTGFAPDFRLEVGMGFHDGAAIDERSAIAGLEVGLGG